MRATFIRVLCAMALLLIASPLISAARASITVLPLDPQLGVFSDRITLQNGVSGFLNVSEPLEPHGLVAVIGAIVNGAMLGHFSTLLEPGSSNISDFVGVTNGGTLGFVSTDSLAVALSFIGPGPGQFSIPDGVPFHETIHGLTLNIFDYVDPATYHSATFSSDGDGVPEAASVAIWSLLGLASCCAVWLQRRRVTA